MTVLFKNDLIEYLEGEKRRIRLLWLNAAATLGFTINTGAALALPEPVELPVLLDDLDAGRARLLLEDPYGVVVASEDDLPKRHREIRDLRWNIIRDLVMTEPAIYDASRRGQMIAARLLAGGTTKRTIYKDMRRYWQRGQTPNALLPNYFNCGARGKARKPGTAKRGRPVKYGSLPGVNITVDIRKVFRVGTTRYRLANSKFDLHKAYENIVGSFFSEKSFNPDTGLVEHETADAMKSTGFPSFGQYAYWVEKEFDKLDVKRKRLGAKVYDKDMRGLLGTSTAQVMGPGSRYQIDATVADVYLLSRLNRHRIVGRPVLYVVIDVFSRMIVGLYVGFEGPSWVGAMMALANTAADKVAFCRSFGITIEEADWPCRHLPGILLGDRGEIESAKINTLINNFHVSVENAASYRADWKGIVEQRFRLLPAKFAPYVPGYIEADFRARGGHDYRLDAVLDLYEFTQIIIQCALHHNNHHEFAKYDKDRDVLADGVPPIPVELWDWGIQNRSGQLRQFPEELVRYSLLPVDTATVTEFGIKWRGGFYACPRAVKERWLDRARQGRSWRVSVAYDPRRLDTTYLRDEADPFKFEVCALTERSRARQNLSLWEVEQQEQVDKRASADRRPGAVLAGSDLVSNIETVVKQAKDKQGAPSTESTASRTRNIRENRAAEKEMNRAEEAFRLRSKPGAGGKPAEVIPFPARKSGEPDYSAPDINEILCPQDDKKDD